MRTGNKWVPVAAALGIVTTAFLMAWYVAPRSDPIIPKPPSLPISDTEKTNFPANYVGSAHCQHCHADIFAAWKKSDHAKSMAEANTINVLGDFNHVQFDRDGFEIEFFHHDGGYYIRTDNADGSKTVFKIAYTFGHYPLQQYLIEFPDGRLQALSVAWDSRPQSEHGQRWFHLYPGERINHTDALHWTGPALNWNGMCAQCHSTGLQQSFDATTGHFAARWSDLNVACEACHGPASGHLQWTRAPDEYPRKGLTFALNGSTHESWQFVPTRTTAQRQGDTAPNRSELDTCAYCHARRATVSNNHQPGQPLAASHQLALLEPDLYFADGQQRDEVFEYGSFLQSKMFQAGVTCSHCHDPHAGTLRTQGNALCTQCHHPATFDTPKHHHHSSETAGSQCIHCHMPARVYMQVDTRRDHHFQIPRPDLSAALEAPDVCTDCHNGQTPEWAAQQIKQWLPDLTQPVHFGQALYAGQHWQADAPRQLELLISNTVQPAIVRASALQLLARYRVQRLKPMIELAATDPDPLLRQQAATALSQLPPTRAAALANQLLVDPMLTVRIQTAQHLLQWPPDLLQQVNMTAWQQALDDMRAGLHTRRDRAESLLGLAALAQHQGHLLSSETLLQEAVARQPHHIPAWINLSEILRQRGQPQAAHTLLRQALDTLPKNAELHYALALAQTRAGNMTPALSSFAMAVQLAPQSPEYVYAYAIALHDNDKQKHALHVLEEASQRFPGHPDLITLLLQYALKAQHAPLIRKAATQLQAIDPEDPTLQRFQSFSTVNQ